MLLLQISKLNIGKSTRKVQGQLYGFKYVYKTTTGQKLANNWRN